MTAGNGVPFVDLITPHLELEDELLEAVRAVTRSASFVGGPILERFEEDFAKFSDAEHCVGVGSGTDALRFALMAAGVGKGDIVLTVPNTFVATIEAIIQAGAAPAFVDIDPRTFNMSVDALREYLETRCDRSGTGSTVDRSTGGRVKAVVPVHLYGQMCDMDAIMDLASEFRLEVIEDACQAHGSEYFSARTRSWRKAGSIGTAAGFSFYPGKNLGACGEAGAVTTRDKGIADRIRMIRDHGQSRKYHHSVEGYNGRLDTLQAAMLQVKLPRLAAWNQQRREAARTYNDLLGGVDGVEVPFEPEWSRAVYHLYVVRTPRRDELREFLGQRNIGAGLHYPVPLHLQEGYRHLGYADGEFPVSEAASRDILSLPMFPQLLRAQQTQVIEAIMQFSQVPSMTAASRD
jgi:dTDP-4-amino-4,6-dideoxygalactose transaminase